MMAASSFISLVHRVRPLVDESLIFAEQGATVLDSVDNILENTFENDVQKEMQTKLQEQNETQEKIQVENRHEKQSRNTMSFKNLGKLADGKTGAFLIDARSRKSHVKNSLKPDSNDDSDASADASVEKTDMPVENSMDSNAADQMDGSAEQTSDSLHTLIAHDQKCEQYTIRADIGGEDAIALIDVEALDWWTLVHDDGSTGAQTLEPGKETKCVLDDDAWTIINDVDFVDALGEFIQRSLAENGVETLPPEQLRDALNNALLPLRRKSGVAGRMWEWGKTAYHAYSWGATVVQLYNQPLVLQLAFRGAASLASWVLMIVL